MKNEFKIESNKGYVFTPGDLNEGATVRLAQDFTMSCWFGGESPYRVHIPAGAVISIISFGNAAQSAKWRVELPDGAKITYT